MIFGSSITSIQEALMSIATLTRFIQNFPGKPNTSPKILSPAMVQTLRDQAHSGVALEGDIFVVSFSSGEKQSEPHPYLVGAKASASSPAMRFFGTNSGLSRPDWKWVLYSP